MGNRAHVIFADETFSTFGPAVYLHWNGGPESVYAFLAELDRRKVRGSDNLSYQTARFCQVAGEFFDQDQGERACGGLSLGVTNGPESLEPGALEPFDHGDNGIYVIYRGKGLPVVRRFKDNREFPPENVEAERSDVLGSSYLDPTDGIPGFFAKHYPNLMKYG